MIRFVKNKVGFYVLEIFNFWMILMMNFGGKTDFEMFIPLNSDRKVEYDDEKILEWWKKFKNQPLFLRFFKSSSGYRSGSWIFKWIFKSSSHLQVIFIVFLSNLLVWSSGLWYQLLGSVSSLISREKVKYSFKCVFSIMTRVKHYIIPNAIYTYLLKPPQLWYLTLRPLDFL